MQKGIETRGNLCTEQWAAYDRVKLWGLLFTENSSRRKLSCTSHIDEGDNSVSRALEKKVKFAGKLLRIRRSRKQCNFSRLIKTKTIRGFDVCCHHRRINLAK